MAVITMALFAYAVGVASGILLTAMVWVRHKEKEFEKEESDRQ